MALKPVDAAAYAVCRTFIAAGAALFQRYEQTGDWPNTDPMVTQLTNVLFDYIPLEAVPLTPEQIADDPACAIPRQRSCFYLGGPEVFNPTARAALIDALDARTPEDVRQQFDTALATRTDEQIAADPGGTLEWWVVAIAAGALIAIGGLSFAGATVVKIAGYLLAAWASYGLLTAQTPEGQSLISKYAELLAAGFDTLMQKAKTLGIIVLGVIVGALLWRFAGRSR